MKLIRLPACMPLTLALCFALYRPLAAQLGHSASTDSLFRAGTRDGALAAEHGPTGNAPGLAFLSGASIGFFGTFGSFGRAIAAGGLGGVFGAAATANRVSQVPDSLNERLSLQDSAYAKAFRQEYARRVSSRAQAKVVGHALGGILVGFLAMAAIAFTGAFSD